MTSLSSSQPRLPSAALRAFLATARGSQCVGRLDAKLAPQLLQSVYVACNENLRFARMGRKYLARELCGDDFWYGRLRCEQICSGICLAYLVDELHVLPLRIHWTKSGKGSKRYWLRGPADGAVPSRPSISPAPILPQNIKISQR